MDVINERIERNLAKQEAYFEGVDDGIVENQKQIIMNMYNKNLELKDISEFTGLSRVEVEI